MIDWIAEKKQQMLVITNLSISATVVWILGGCVTTVSLLGGSSLRFGREIYPSCGTCRDMGRREEHWAWVWFHVDSEEGISPLWLTELRVVFCACRKTHATTIGHHLQKQQPHIAAIVQVLWLGLIYSEVFNLCYLIWNYSAIMTSSIIYFLWRILHYCSKLWGQ